MGLIERIGDIHYVVNFLGSFLKLESTFVGLT